MRRAPIALLSVVALAACASDVFVPYPSPPGASEPAGSVLVKFSSPMRGVHVAIDGALVAEDEYTERVVIEDVPAGDRELAVVGSEASHTHEVDHREIVSVAPGRETLVLIATPPRSSAYWVYMAFSWAAIVVPWLVFD